MMLSFRKKTNLFSVSANRRADVTGDEAWKKELLASRRFVERVRKDFDATRGLCKRQREMIAEQRRLLEELDRSYAFAFCERPAAEEAEAAHHFGEDANAGE